MTMIEGKDTEHIINEIIRIRFNKRSANCSF